MRRAPPPGFLIPVDGAYPDQLPQESTSVHEDRPNAAHSTRHRNAKPLSPNNMLPSALSPRGRVGLRPSPGLPCAVPTTGASSAKQGSSPAQPHPGQAPRLGPKKPWRPGTPRGQEPPTLQVSPPVRNWPSQGTRNKAPAGEGAADAWLPVRADRLAGPRPLQPRFAPVSVRTAWTAGLTESSPGHDPHSEVTCFSQEHTGPPTFPEGSLRARPTRTFSAAP